jgi:hypothetical protein
LLCVPGFAKVGLTVGHHCKHAYPYTHRDTISALPDALKSLNRVVHADFLATVYFVQLRHSLGLPSKEWEEAGYGEVVHDELINKDSERYSALRPHFIKFKDAPGVENYYSKYALQHRNAEHNIDDVAVLTEELEPLPYTQTGLDEWDTVDILSA